MQVTLTLNEYELNEVLKNGTLQALSQSITAGKEKQLNQIQQGQVKNEAIKSPQSEKKGAADKKVDQAPETLSDKKPESTAEVNEVGDTAPDELPFEPDKNEGSGEEITLEEVRAKMAELTKAGKNEKVKALFAEFGAKKLTEVDKKHYAALLKKASEL